MRHGLFVLTGILLSALITVPDLVASSHSTQDDHYGNHTHTYFYKFIKHLRAIHSKEVFDYCVDEHGVDSRRLPPCLKRQEDIKTGILERAQRQLGLRSLAEFLYHDCLDFYLGEAISKTAACVETRLLLRKRLNQAVAEAEIYRRCDSKWRKHGLRAVKNCSVHAARYFKDTGKYRD